MTKKRTEEILTIEITERTKIIKEGLCDEALSNVSAKKSPKDKLSHRMVGIITLQTINELFRTHLPT